MILTLKDKKADKSIIFSFLALMFVLSYYLLYLT